MDGLVVRVATPTLGTLPGLVPAPLGLAMQAAERELAVLSLAQRELAV